MSQWNQNGTSPTQVLTSDDTHEGDAAPQEYAQPATGWEQRQAAVPAVPDSHYVQTPPAEPTYEQPYDDFSGVDEDLQSPATPAEPTAVPLSPIEQRYQENLQKARTVAPGTPVPTRGLALLDYKVWQKNYRFVGRDFIPPPMGRREQKIYEMRRAEEQLLIEELIALANEVQRVLTILNSKGGVGKTPLACYLATVLYYAIEAIIELIDINENDGTTCFWMGIKRWQTATLRYGIRHVHQFSSYSKMANQMARPPMQGNAVRVMGSDPTDTAPFASVELVNLLYTLMQSCHSQVNDGGNGNQHEANKAGAAAASDLLFPAMAGDQLSFERVLSTMTNFMDPYLYGEKVRTSFVVVNATRPTDTIDTVMAMLQTAMFELNENRKDLTQVQLEHLPEGKLTLDTFGIVPERVALIPFDPYIAAKRPAHALSLHIDTRIAYLKLLVAIFRQAAPAPNLAEYLVKWREQQVPAGQGQHL
jgi:Mrp family chromosome partitioning ATPase